MSHKTIDIVLVGRDKHGASRTTYMMSLPPEGTKGCPMRPEHWRHECGSPGTRKMYDSNRDLTVDVCGIHAY